MTARTSRLLVTATAGALGLAMLAGCPGEYDDTVQANVAEDCDPEDQRKREDDCGYWQRGTEVRTGAQPDATWLWIYYSWVIVGRTTVPPAGWTPPKGLKFPTRTVTVPRKACAMGALLAPPPPRPPAPAPRPAPPRVQQPAPVYKPPAGQRVAC